MNVDHVIDSPFIFPKQEGRNKWCQQFSPHTHTLKEAIHLFIDIY